MSLAATDSGMPVASFGRALHPTGSATLDLIWSMRGVSGGGK
eukprot:SAG11_NODE_28442_length_321_cov_1.387387_2_plen_41_part_01